MKNCQENKVTTLGYVVRVYIRVDVDVSWGFSAWVFDSIQPLPHMDNTKDPREKKNLTKT